MELWSRRKFFLTSLASSAIAGAGKLFGGAPPADAAVVTPVAAQGKRPLIISSANGLHAVDKGMDVLRKGGDTLDAAIAAVTVVEDEQAFMWVGGIADRSRVIVQGQDFVREGQKVEAVSAAELTATAR